MLAYGEKAETVLARIERLDLGRRFDAVVLASNLIDTRAPADRRAFLAACLRHADQVVVEGLPIGWQPEEADRPVGAVTSRLRVECVDEQVVYGEAEYTSGIQHWRHPFAMRLFANADELAAALAEARLRLDRRLDAEGGRWFVAVPT